MKFVNRTNNYVEEASLPWLWTLLFGPFYFAVKGIWTHCFVGLILAILTYGISWIAYAFFAGYIVKRHYLRRGWVEAEEHIIVIKPEQEE